MSSIRCGGGACNRWSTTYSETGAGTKRASTTASRQHMNGNNDFALLHITDATINDCGSPMGPVGTNIATNDPQITNVIPRKYRIKTLYLDKPDQSTYAGITVPQNNTLPTIMLPTCKMPEDRRSHKYSVNTMQNIAVIRISRAANICFFVILALSIEMQLSFQHYEYQIISSSSRWAARSYVATSVRK